jgi:hypothetical protein
LSIPYFFGTEAVVFAFSTTLFLDSPASDFSKPADNSATPVVAFVVVVAPALVPVVVAGVLNVDVLRFAADVRIEGDAVVVVDSVEVAVVRNDTGIADVVLVGRNVVVLVDGRDVVVVVRVVERSVEVGTDDAVVVVVVVVVVLVDVVVLVGVVVLLVVLVGVTVVVVVVSDCCCPTVETSS